MGVTAGQLYLEHDETVFFVTPSDDLGVRRIFQHPWAVSVSFSIPLVASLRVILVQLPDL